MISDILLIGLSRFARRRLLPVVATSGSIERLHVASRSGADELLDAVPKRGQIFRDYQAAIDGCNAGLVYVSLTNAAHAEWVERALEAGHHVIVDKPAFTDLNTAERLVALARARRLVLGEATTYGFHPAIVSVGQLFADLGSAPRHVTASFTPPVPASDFRYRRALGGGALLDTGPYFASLGRLLWDAEPVRVCASISDWSREREVDTAYSVLASYGEGRVVVGHYGFTSEYSNWIELLGVGVSVRVPRVFSTPPDMVTELRAHHHNELVIRQVGAANAMALFLDDVVAAIARADCTTHSEALLSDARVRDRLGRAAAQWS